MAEDPRVFLSNCTDEEFGVTSEDLYETDASTRGSFPVRLSLALAALALSSAGVAMVMQQTKHRAPVRDLQWYNPFAQVSATTTTTTAVPNCLCVFDIDRTLTGKQQWDNGGHPCPGDVRFPNLWDTAYVPGHFVASAAAENLDKTFCGKCYSGIVSHGTASNDAERGTILKFLGGIEKTKTDWWHNIGYTANSEVKSAMVLQAVDGQKQDHVRGMVTWFNEIMDVPINDENVYFFDDIATNVSPFTGTGFNARQISCASRGSPEGNYAPAGKLGGCGATVDEIVEKKGIHLCPA